MNNLSQKKDNFIEYQLVVERQQKEILISWIEKKKKEKQRKKA
jgi:hypothetical protein